MPKLSRNVAQGRIYRSVAAVDQVLLRAEIRCDVRIRQAFADAVPGRPAGTVAAVRNNADLRARWVEQHTTAILAAEEHVTTLAEAAAATTVEAIGRELGWAEESLPATYAGIADEAVTDLSVERVVAGRMDQWRAAAFGYRALYRTEQTHELGQAKTIDELVLRLWSPEPSGIRGHNRAGVWWTAVGGLQAKGRWVSTDVQNKIRLQAMRRFNANG